LITVPEKFETAIEAVLGATLQNIVTDTRNDAKKAIDLLKVNHTGRATFLPIFSIKSHFSNLKDFSRFAGCFGVASDLISFDNKYLEIIKSLLGNTLIVDTLDTAIKIAKETTDSFKIVSLEGDIVNTIGTMSGGSQKVKTDNLLSRKRNISSLEAEIKDIESSILTNESEYSKLSLSEESLSKDAECISAVIKDNEILIAGENEKLYSLESSFAAIGEKVKYFAIEKKELSEQIETFNKDSDDIKESIAELEKVIASYQTEVDQYKIKNKSQMEIRDNLNLDITNYKVSVSSFDENISAIDETLERINADMDSLTKSIEKKEALRERLSSEIEAITINIDNTQNKIEEVKLQISESQKKLDELSAQKASVERELVSLEETALEDSRKADETKEKISNSEIKKARLDMEFDNISNKMWEDYQITYADALKLKNDSVNNLPSKINSLKSQIKALGSINIDSIEEYKTVSERFKFMSAQKEDLDQSEARLHKVITDMTVTMKEEFLKKFKIINAHFGEVFSELFGGGQALIKLADESNILESGIDIDVQPPGKKLQNMMLLSGGERAFTAIALLFAILKINPSPFCLLDEIEAALDDVNVYRFADYVKKFSDNIQFIIITHRKGTMESADSIYGVTMEERGISKLISMKLN
jgi:chromosome segregation protein